MEARNYHQAIVLTDRTDYLSPLTNNLSYILACEKLFEIEAEVPHRAQVVRVIMCELSRIGSHLIWLGTHALDLGATTVFLYCWREREQILSINELVSGVRMMTSFFRIGGLAADVPAEFAERVEAFVRAMPGRVDEYELLLSRNPIFMDRTRGIGTVSREDAIKYGMSGPCLRGSGRAPSTSASPTPTAGTSSTSSTSPSATRGTSTPGTWCGCGRCGRACGSSARGWRCCADCRGPPSGMDNPRIAFPKRDKIHTSMESLIHHFKLVSEGPVPPAGEAYAPVESPRGELGTYVFSDGSNKPHRVRIRAPGFYNLQALPQLTGGAPGGGRGGLHREHRHRAGGDRPLTRPAPRDSAFGRRCLSQAFRDLVLNDYLPRYPSKRAALIPAMWAAQNELGWLSAEAMEEIGELLDVDPTDVNAVASFYTMFHLRPVGKQPDRGLPEPGLLGQRGGGDDAPPLRPAWGSRAGGGPRRGHHRGRGVHRALRRVPRGLRQGPRGAGQPALPRAGARGGRRALPAGHPPLQPGGAGAPRAGAVRPGGDGPSAAPSPTPGVSRS